MMVNDQVQVKTQDGIPAEYAGRAGFIISKHGKDEQETATVRLDESDVHHQCDADFLLSDLRKLG